MIDKLLKEKYKILEEKDFSKKDEHQNYMDKKDFLVKEIYPNIKNILGTSNYPATSCEEIRFAQE